MAMARVDMKKLYENRIKQIDIDISMNIKYKRWADVTRLKEEKKRLENLITIINSR